jgi:predicted RNA-binding protein (virulence factor B family)
LDIDYNEVVAKMGGPGIFESIGTPRYLMVDLTGREDQKHFRGWCETNDDHVMKMHEDNYSRFRYFNLQTGFRTQGFDGSKK